MNVTDVQKWLAVDRNEPGYSILTEEEIVDVVTGPEDEGEKKKTRKRSQTSQPSLSIRVLLKLHSLAAGSTDGQ